MLSSLIVKGLTTMNNNTNEDANNYISGTKIRLVVNSESL